MGGELTLSSSPGQGSTFTVRLYLPEIAADPSWQSLRTVALRPVIGYIAPRRKLLVVDDQPLQRQLLAALLVPLGFTIQEAASGRECLESVLNDPPDLVLLDITMDDLDGWQTAEMLRGIRTAEQLPIVFVSANQFEFYPERLAALHCQAFIGKPVIESELLDALARALQLEWVRDNTPLLPFNPGRLSAAMDTNGEQEQPQPRSLPEALREDLTRLARQGQAGALRDLLRRARNDLPEHSASLQMLQTCADRFDFETLANHLREPENAAPD